MLQTSGRVNKQLFLNIVESVMVTMSTVFHGASAITKLAGVSAEGSYLDPVQLEAAICTIAVPGCVHALCSPARGSLMYLLCSWLSRSRKHKKAASSSAFLVTGRRRHRDPILSPEIRRRARGILGLGWQTWTRRYRHWRRESFQHWLCIDRL